MIDLTTDTAVGVRTAESLRAEAEALRKYVYHSPAGPFDTDAVRLARAEETIAKLSFTVRDIMMTVASLLERSPTATPHALSVATT